MLTRRFLSQFDYFLFLAVLMLALIGALGIYNASAEEGNYSLFARHLLWIGLGLFVCLFVTSVDYHFLTDHAFLLYGLTTLLLLGILFFGKEINGSKSWFTIGDISFQPSEIAKVAVILVLARYLSEMSSSYLGHRHLFALGGLTLCPMILITLQGDLGTALMYLPILLGVVIVGGLRMRFLIGIFIITLCVAPLGWFLLRDYQKERILVTLDSWTRSSGYRIPVSSVSNRHRIRRSVRQGIGTGVAESAGIRSRDSHRLHLRYSGGGNRVCRLHLHAHAVLVGSHAFNPNRRERS